MGVSTSPLKTPPPLSYQARLESTNCPGPPPFKQSSPIYWFFVTPPPPPPPSPEKSDLSVNPQNIKVFRP